MNGLESTPEVFTADYTGEPGARTFYVQARDENGTNTYLVEKAQVALLAEKLQEILLTIDADDTIRSAVAARDPALALAEPLEPRGRVGAIGLGYDEAAERLLIVLHEVTEGEEGAEVVLTPETGDRFYLRLDQARALVLHALAAIGEGRPLCQLCGLPMDPSGHVCPAHNGHRAPA